MESASFDKPVDLPPVSILEERYPILKHMMTILRDKTTDVAGFRETLKKIGYIVAGEATRPLKSKPKMIETPLAPYEGTEAAEPLTLVPILRAGLGLAGGMLEVLPHARVSHVGLSRDEKTLEPHLYYQKIAPDTASGLTVVVDPMLATAGTASYVIDMLRKKGCDRLVFACIVASPEGIKVMQTKFPDVPIIAVALDDHLNDHGYIVPGLGDCGDRCYGTL
ncbi:Uracil phosphoribosyl transferase like protein [Aduncisulcus paluster]|uniref:uracil phosphoribosyltransferase n=1 Tax=Aduncisulcus paluster TaxID=2918883 RepID=A0ABQ5K8J8_9EUKA|nr:Uracil phosphoribosyl transferase like protein [Aduncisulcus paluster]